MTPEERRGGGETFWEGLNPPYRTIVADPPWPSSAVKERAPFGTRHPNVVRKPYTTMELGGIGKLPVAELAYNLCTLFLWITPALNRKGCGVWVAEMWGFSVTSEFVWEKPNIGMGRFPRTSHEILLVCTCGTGALAMANRNVHSVQRVSQEYGNNGGKLHSAKPAAFYDLIEENSPGPYVELFARQPRLGWDHWGYGIEGVA